MASNPTLAPEETRTHAATVHEGGHKRSSPIRRIQQQAVAGLGVTADAGRQAMQSMSLDPASAGRQAVHAVRKHPYLTAALLLGFVALIVGIVRV